jgi:hypothetical protein
MNQKMACLLGANADNPADFIGPVPSELLAELKEGFEEVQGCILPRDPDQTPFEIEEGNDETGIECQVSKINFIEYRRDDEPFEKMLRMGVAYGFALKQQLEKSGLRGPFRVIVGADSEGEYPSVTVRYHRLRLGQEWLGTDLESYANAILAVDFVEGESSKFCRLIDEPGTNQVQGGNTETEPSLDSLPKTRAAMPVSC